MLNIELNELMTSLLENGISVDVVGSGISMFPLIPPQSMIRISPQRNITRGSIAVFRRKDGKYIAHRVVKTDDGVVCRGDSCLNNDPLLTSDNIVGTVSHVTIRGRMFSLTSKSARLYARLTMATFPVSARLNNIMARLALKLKLIRL